MKWIRKNPTGLALILGTVVLIVSIALFVKSYQGAGPSASPKAARGSDTPGATARPGDAATPGGSFFPSSGAPLPGKTLTPDEPGGIVFGNLPTHALAVTVTSAGRVGRIGYLIPTSPDSSYGDVTRSGPHWSLSTTVVGRPGYAAIFIQAGASGTPITCTISVDGVVKDTKTTSGPHGSTVCLG